MLSKLKKHLVLALAGFLHYSGLIRLWMWLRHHNRGGHDTCVLGLHRVLCDDGLQRANSLPGIVLREKTFAALVECLHRQFSVISLDTFLSSDGIRSPRLPCLLTFDDGWRDNFTTALPVLKKYRIPAVIFVVTSLIDTKGTFWVERVGKAWKDRNKRCELLAATTKAAERGTSQARYEEVVENLKHLPSVRRDEILAAVLGNSGAEGPSSEDDRVLSWKEAEALQKEGIEIEAHSATHPLLVYENDEVVSRELCQCRQILEQKLGKRVRAFAYPNGTWDERVRRMVQEAGYECAFVTRRGWHRRGADRFAIRRIMLHEGMVTSPGGRFSPALLALRLSGWI